MRGVIAMLVITLAACTDPKPPAAAVDAATRRQRDSVVARMPVPGAPAVDRALGVLENAQARAAVFDTIR